jgi:hypothetical protein
MASDAKMLSSALFAASSFTFGKARHPERWNSIPEQWKIVFELIEYAQLAR